MSALGQKRTFVLQKVALYPRKRTLQSQFDNSTETFGNSRKFWWAREKCHDLTKTMT
jgi:hypothetical protein